MEHLQIAYDLFVIMIGLAALSIVVFWAVRTGESDLRDFRILYTCFTLVLAVVETYKRIFDFEESRKTIDKKLQLFSFHFWLDAIR